jgi:hypothetical protein
LADIERGDKQTIKIMDSRVFPVRYFGNIRKRARGYMSLINANFAKDHGNPLPKDEKLDIGAFGSFNEPHHRLKLRSPENL